MSETTDKKLDKLARSIAEGFEDTNGRIADLDKKLDKRFDSLDGRFATVEALIMKDFARRLRVVEDALQIKGA